MQESIFENIHYELAHLNKKFNGDIDKINARMLMVPEQDQYPFLKRELDQVTHELCLELTHINLWKWNNIEDISLYDICCIVSDGRESCHGLDYNIEEWKEALVLYWHNKCKYGLERGILTHMLEAARKKLIKDLIATSLCDYPELFSTKKDNRI